jgi:hypothetical protein
LELLLSEAPPEAPLLLGDEAPLLLGDGAPLLLGDEAPLLLGDEAPPDALLPDEVEPLVVPPALLEPGLSPACSGAAACSWRESLPSPSLSRVLKSLSCGVPFASSLLTKPSLSLSNAWNIFSAPDIVAPELAEPDAPALGEPDALELGEPDAPELAEPDAPDAADPDAGEPPAELFSVALGALVVPLAPPADPLPPVVCAATGAAKAATTAKAITVLMFI